MRNRGKKDYLKPVHHDILLTELMYYIFSFVAPLLMETVNENFINLPVTVNFRDILAVLLTSKNWRNLFKNYVITTSTKDSKCSINVGFKYSIDIFTRKVKLIEYKHKPWYKHISHYHDNDDILILNQRITGRYFRILTAHDQLFAVGFNLSKIYIQIIYTDNYSVFYYPISKTEFKYILHARCVNHDIRTVLYSTYNLPADHPDWTVINYVITRYALFE